jgi:localization factor PodJL
MTVGARRGAMAIDPKMREIAETLARQAGLSLSDWLSGMAGSEGPDEALTHVDFAPAAGAGGYLETPRAGAGSPSRFEAQTHPGDEMVRMTAALDRLAQRIETAEERSTSAIGGVERTVRGALSRLSESEQEQIATAARLESAVAETQAAQARVAARLLQMEEQARGPRSAEAVRSLEAALGKVAGHLYEGEEATAQAFAEMRERLEKAEAGGAGAAEVVEAVVSRLGARLEEGEARTSGTLRELQASFAALDARLGSLEARPEAAADTAAVERLAADLRVAEQRSAHAIERIGHEVVDMAGALVRRVQSVEHRSADTIEQVGGEVARIAQAMETRLVRADAVQAQAMETLGSEIGRIAERLGERIATSERRSAAAIDEVGEQVARVADRLAQRQERAGDELAERIRLSEERTARILDDARATLERFSARESGPPPRMPPAERSFEGPEEPIYGEDPFTHFQPPAPAPEALAAVLPLAEPAPAPAREPPPAPDFGQEDLDAAEGFADLPGEGPEPLAPGPASEPFASGAALEAAGFEAAAPPALPPEAAALDIIVPPAEEAATRLWNPGAFPPEPPHLTTREAVERARAAALAASNGGKAPSRRDEPHGASPPQDDLAPAPRGGPFSRIPFEVARPPGRPGPAALGIGLAAAFGVALGGLWVVEGGQQGAGGGRLAHFLSGGGAGADRSGASAARVAQSQPGAVAGPAQMAVALAPDAMAPPALSPERQRQFASDYSAAVLRVEGRQKGGVADLLRLADQNYAPAQFYLAKLYESGSPGLKKDPAAARRWTERAAEGGEVKAMHNLALDYFEGVGGPADQPLAAQWFRRAADQGLTDSQYNLGRLYEEGFGVAQNPAEAYKWYLVAGRAGDAESLAGAARMKARISAPARLAAERDAAAFRAVVGGPLPAQIPQLAGPMVTAQRALSALGYYQGPTDGSASPALRLALSAYQRDQGLPATGAPDAVTVAKLAAIAGAPPPS